MNKTQNGSGASNIKQEYYIKPEDKVLGYAQQAMKIVNDTFRYSQHNADQSVVIQCTVEIAKMIQLEEHRGDK